MPLSFEAFNSITASLKESPKRILAKHNIVVVFPTPGGPAMIIFGQLPCSAKTDNLSTVSSFPTISENT